MQICDILIFEVSNLEKKTSKIVEYFHSTALYEFILKVTQFVKHHKNIASTIVILIFAFGVATYPIMHSLFNGPFDDETPQKQTFSDLTIQKIYVTVAGEVNKPGMYEMTTDDRINDAIEKAGGTTENAYLTNINLAQILTDGQYICVMNKEQGEKLETESASSGSFQGIVNINTATIEQLCQLPGIGKSTAQKIIEYREVNDGFRTTEELKHIKGIGDSKYNDIKNNITV